MRLHLLVLVDDEMMMMMNDRGLCIMALE